MSKIRQENFRNQMNIEHWRENARNYADAKQREEYYKEYSGQKGMSKDSKVFLKRNER